MDIKKESVNLVDLLTGAHAKLRTSFSQIRFDNRPPRMRLFLTSFLSIYSNISSWIVLYKIGQDQQAQVLLRSVLESYADLINLRRHEDYADRLQYGVAKSHLKILTQLAGLGRNPPPSAEEHIKMLSSVVTHAKNRNIKPLTVKEKFELAGLIEYYVAGYCHWSSFAHNDCIGALFDCVQMDVPVVDTHYYRHPDRNMNFVQVHVACEVLENSAHFVAEFVGGYDEGLYSMFCSDCQMIRAHLTCISSAIEEGNATP